MSQLVTILRAGVIICILTGIQGCAFLAEKGKHANFYCTFRGNPNSITWQVIIDNRPIILTTCNSAVSACRDQQPSEYTGRVLSWLPGNYTVNLDIKSARRDETRFRCVADLGGAANDCNLLVYKWPSTPTGKVQITRTHAELSFSTFVYPGVQAVIRRRELALTRADIESSRCNVNESTSDPNGDYQAVCTWRIPFGRLLFTNTFYVEMRVLDTNNLIGNRSAVVSEDLLVQLGTVNVSLVNCPAGPYVSGGVIQKGKSATCTCRATTSGLFLTGQARWYTLFGSVVGVENSTDGSSTLTMSYPSALFATFECRGINPTRQYQYIRYRPQFSFFPN